jgi:ATP-binding cassette subfamily F protein 3
LKKALQQFDGTILLVSHDRDFLSGLTNRLFEIKDNRIAIHFYSIDEYLERNKQQAADTKRDNKEQAKEVQIQKQAVSNELSYDDRKKLKNLKNKSQKLEQEITSVEAKIKQKEEEMSSASSEQLLKEYAQLKAHLDSLFIEWEKLEEQISVFENVKS